MGHYFHRIYLILLISCSHYGIFLRHAETSLNILQE